MKGLMIAIIGVMAAGIASAKLPSLSDEAKAKAAEAKAKAAWSDKVAAYKLCLAQDRVAEYYRKNKGSEVKSNDSTAPAVTPTSTQAPSSGTASAAAPAPVPPCQ